MASIVDVFGAITDRRVYKDPIEPEQAMKIMSNMGDMIDLGLLSVFKEMLLDAVTPDTNA
jgi:HD-GYP domain-containing protein (c-di-GMP phosphodiesterase class II)